MARIVFLAALLCFGGCATYVATSGGVVVKEEGGVAISAADRNVIREYFRSAGVAVKPLPAGVVLQKPLPKGVATQSLPAALERRLSPVPAGCRRVHTGGNVLLIDVRSGIVQDIAAGG